MHSMRIGLLASLVILINGAVLTTEDVCAGGCGTLYACHSPNCEQITEQQMLDICTTRCASQLPLKCFPSQGLCENFPGFGTSHCSPGDAVIRCDCDFSI